MEKADNEMFSQYFSSLEEETGEELLEHSSTTSNLIEESTSSPVERKSSNPFAAKTSSPQIPTPQDVPTSPKEKKPNSNPFALKSPSPQKKPAAFSALNRFTKLRKLSNSSTVVCSR